MSTATAPAAPVSPPEGTLGVISVPRLLAEAWHERRSGTLQLAHAGHSCRILVHEGSPFSAESTQGEDDLARSLAESGRITTADRMRIEKVAEERGCAQASAVLALQLVDGAVLYGVLRDRARELVAATFGWEQGHYRWTALDQAPPRSARPFDLPSLLQTELPRRWGSDRLFAALMPDSHRFMEISPRLRRVVVALRTAGAPADRVIRRLDGTTRVGQILGECAGDPLAAATLWTLLRTGVVRLHDAPAAQGLPADLEFEVVVEGTGAGTSTSPAVRPGKADGQAKADRGEALRAEMKEMIDRLAELDHYGALGLEPDASTAQIKKAYFKAAKQYHPDALARAGASDLREDAARIFARISEAFEILSDPARRSAYDAGGRDEPEIDTGRLAQAETSYRKGEILLRMGNFQAALEYLEPAVELWPEEAAYHSGLGWALYKQPRAEPERARTHLEQAHQLAPDDPVTLFRLGVVLRASGENEAGDRYIERARSLESTVSR